MKEPIKIRITGKGLNLLNLLRQGVSLPEAEKIVNKEPLRQKKEKK